MRAKNTERVWGSVAARVRKGYVPAQARQVTPRWWLVERAGPDAQSCVREFDASALTKALEPVRKGVGFVLPTVLRRARGSLGALVSEMCQHVARVHGETSLPVLLIVGLQWLDNEEEEAVSLLREALAAAPQQALPVAIIGLTLRGPGKAETLRSCFPRVSELCLRGLGWVDDDIVLEPECLARLTQGFLRREGRPCVVGGTKIAHQREAAPSRWLFSIKKRIAPAINYPHGCCIFVDASLFDRGLPNRYPSEDGYFCYEMLSRAPEEASQRLALIPDALCHYWVGADRGRLLTRLRRLLLNHVLFLADYPAPVGQKYLAEYLYPGFWPLSHVPPANGLKPNDPGRWALQLLHLLCLSATALELVARGSVGRPLREVRWGT